MAGPVVKEKTIRISVLTESLVRWNTQRMFLKMVRQVVQNRDFGPVACSCRDRKLFSTFADISTSILADLLPDRLYIELKGR